MLFANFCTSNVHRHSCGDRKRKEPFLDRIYFVIFKQNAKRFLCRMSHQSVGFYQVSFIISDFIDFFVLSHYQSMKLPNFLCNIVEKLRTRLFLVLRIQS